MFDKNTAEKLSRIIELELKITDALSKGHRASDSDKFKSDREELEKLREELNMKRNNNTNHK